MLIEEYINQYVSEKLAADSDVGWGKRTMGALAGGAAGAIYTPGVKSKISGAALGAIAAGAEPGIGIPAAAGLVGGSIAATAASPMLKKMLRYETPIGERVKGLVGRPDKFTSRAQLIGGAIGALALGGAAAYKRLARNQEALNEKTSSEEIFDVANSVYYMAKEAAKLSYQQKAKARPCGYVDENGNCHWPLIDEAHVRNAIARLGLEKARENLRKIGKLEQVARRVVNRAKELGIEISPDADIAKIVSVKKTQEK